MKTIKLVQAGGFIKIEVDGKPLDVKLDETIMRSFRMRQSASKMPVTKQSFLSMLETKLSRESIKLSPDEVKKILDLVKEHIGG